MIFHLKGVHVPHAKKTSDSSAIRMTAPKNVILPTVMHIGAPATPIVKKGDYVYVGTLIAEQNGEVSSPVHATVSGTVTAVEDYLLAGGNTVPAIRIESDGQMIPDPKIAPPQIKNKSDFIEAMKQSGIVGLGGAGFPTYAKYNSEKASQIKELIINAAECEPYITSDSVTMTANADDISYGIDAFIKYFDIEKVIIGIEKNKPRAIKCMKELGLKNSKIQVKILSPVYPQGAERVLIYHTTGKKIPVGMLPVDFGCSVSNSSTIAAIGRYLKTGMPLVEKCITVDGNAVSQPKNIIAPIGTSLSDVFEFCGGFTDAPKKVIYGGPMMGITVPDLSAPVLKNTNAVLAFTQKHARALKTTPCIKCSACVNVCPLGVNPIAISKALRNNDIPALKKAGTQLCMECGCCAFVCPAKRPIVQNNKLAKAALKKAETEEVK